MLFSHLMLTGDAPVVLLSIAVYLSLWRLTFLPQFSVESWVQWVKHVCDNFLGGKGSVYAVVLNQKPENLSPYIVTSELSKVQWKRQVSIIWRDLAQHWGPGWSHDYVITSKISEKSGFSMSIHVMCLHSDDNLNHNLSLEISVFDINQERPQIIGHLIMRETGSYGSISLFKNS